MRSCSPGSRNDDFPNRTESRAVATAPGTFEQLFTYTVLTGWLFYGIGAASIFVYRRKWPGHPRPYSVPFYPWTPLLFILAAAALVVKVVKPGVNASVLA